MRKRANNIQSDKLIGSKHSFTMKNELGGWWVDQNRDRERERAATGTIELFMSHKFKLYGKYFELR